MRPSNNTVNIKVILISFLNHHNLDIDPQSFSRFTIPGTSVNFAQLQENILCRGASRYVAGDMRETQQDVNRTKTVRENSSLTTVQIDFW